MQLVLPRMLGSFARVTSVAHGSALWHSAQSGGHCPGLASVCRMPDGMRATKLIVFPEWDNLVQRASSDVMSGECVGTIN